MGVNLKKSKYFWVIYGGKGVAIRDNDECQRAVRSVQMVFKRLNRWFSKHTAFLMFFSKVFQDCIKGPKMFKNKLLSKNRVVLMHFFQGYGRESRCYRHVRVPYGTNLKQWRLQPDPSGAYKRTKKGDFQRRRQSSHTFFSGLYGDS